MVTAQVMGLLATERGAGSGAGATGELERALPSEWAALFVVLVALAVVGAGILAVTCVRHERVVARRHAGRMARRQASRHSLGA
jgi:hypothetical protein